MEWVSDHEMCRLGPYRRIEGRDGFPVYQQVMYTIATATELHQEQWMDRMMYHHAGHWIIASQKAYRQTWLEADELKAIGGWIVESSALTPDQITGTWKRWKQAHQEWEDMPAFSVVLDAEAEIRHREECEAEQSCARVVPLILEQLGRFVPTGEVAHGRAVLRSIDTAGACLRYECGEWSLVVDDAVMHKVPAHDLTPPVENWPGMAELPAAALHSELARRAACPPPSGVDIKLAGHVFSVGDCRGSYFRVSDHDPAPTTMNDRPVLYHAVGMSHGKWTTCDDGLPPSYLYYSRTLEWVVAPLAVLLCDGDDNANKVGHYGEERDRVGWFRVRSNAVDPSTITERWRALQPHDAWYGPACWVPVDIAIHAIE